MDANEELVQILAGSCGAAIAEILHWHRIARRGRWPKYAKSAPYWLLTTLVVLAGGLVAAGVSPNATTPLQLMIIGIAGPQLLQTTVRSRRHLESGEHYLGVNGRSLTEFWQL